MVLDLLSGFDVVGGVIVALVVLVLAVVVRFAIAYATARDRSRGNESPLRIALERTGSWTFGLAAGLGSAVMIGLVQFGDLAGGFVGFVVAHPYFASNFGVGALGAGALSGLVSISTSQYIGLAVAIVGLTMLVVEVDDAV